MAQQISIYDCLGKDYSLGELEVAQLFRNHIPAEQVTAFNVIFNKVNNMPEFAEATQLDKMCIAFKNCGNEDIISTDKQMAGDYFKKLLFESPNSRDMIHNADILDADAFLSKMRTAYSKALENGLLDIDAVNGARTLDAYLARFGVIGGTYSGTDATARSSILLNMLPEEIMQQAFVTSIDSRKLAEAVIADPARFNAGFKIDAYKDDVILYRNEFDYRGVDKLAGLAYALSEQADRFSPANHERIDLDKYRALKGTLSEEMYAIDQECDDIKFSKVRRVGSKLIGTVTVDGKSERFMYDIPNRKLGFWDESLNEKNMLAVMLIRIKRAIEHYFLGGFLDQRNYIHNIGGVSVGESQLDRLIKQAEETDPNPWETRQRFQKEFGEPDEHDNPWNRDDWDER